MKKFIYFFILSVLILNSPVNASEVKINNQNLCQKETQIVNPPKPIDNLVGNYNNEIKIIFSDIDGTILKFDKSNPRTPIPRKVKKTIRELKKANMPFFLVTGRSYEEAKDIANRMGYKSEYIVTQQGAVITNSKGILVCQDAINDKDINPIIDNLESFKKENNLSSKIYVFANGKLYSTESTPLPYNWEKLITIKNLKDLGPNCPIVKIVIWENDPHKLRLIQNDIKKKFPNYRVDFSADCYCDISSPSATKGNAIKKLSKMYGVDLKNVAVFGDAENDLSMLSAVKQEGGLAISVENAMEILKQNSNFTTGSVYNCGFSKGVDKILKNNKCLNK